eukprot:2193365-Alexandrium_andersonii.AAC.1
MSPHRRSAAPQSASVVLTPRPTLPPNSRSVLREASTSTRRAMLRRPRDVNARARAPLLADAPSRL